MNNPWIAAMRLRTLPLTLSCVGLGIFLAWADGKGDILISSLTILTTGLLQILSNFANDYGDTINGADHSEREGPKRMVQTGAITPSQMKNAIISLGILTFISGIALLWRSFGFENLPVLLLFLGLGLASIWAAIRYTMGKNPYGYSGLGDLFVWIFFGGVGVMGAYYLQTLSWTPLLILPAATSGFLSVAVLNVNNVRDIQSDTQAGKFSIPVRLGREKAVMYHGLLLSLSVITAISFTLLNYRHPVQWIFLLTLPLIVLNFNAVRTKINPLELDPWLKQMALTSMLTCLFMGLGYLLALQY